MKYTITQEKGKAAFIVREQFVYYSQKKKKKVTSAAFAIRATRACRLCLCVSVSIFVVTFKSLKRKTRTSLEVNEARNRHPHGLFFFEEHAQLLASTILHLASHITQFAQGLQSSLVGRKSIGSPSRTNRATRNCDNCVSPAGLFSPSTTRSVTTPAIYKVQSQAKQISARKSPGSKKKNAGETVPTTS